MTRQCYEIFIFHNLTFVITFIVCHVIIYIAIYPDVSPNAGTLIGYFEVT